VEHPPKAIRLFSFVSPGTDSRLCADELIAVKGGEGAQPSAEDWWTGGGRMLSDGWHGGGGGRSQSTQDS
jgi:hypothetical protein